MSVLRGCAAVDGHHGAWGGGSGWGQAESGRELQLDSWVSGLGLSREREVCCIG